MRPHAHAIHQCLRLRALAAEAECKHIRLVHREVGKVDAEYFRRQRRVRHGAEPLARGDSEKHERQSAVIGLALAPHATRLDRGEQLTPERQRERLLDLVDEHGDCGRRVGEDHLPEEVGEAAFRRERGFLAPPGLQIDIEVQIVRDSMRESECPALGIGVVAARAELREVHDRGEAARLAQRAGRPRHETGLADRARAEHATILSRADCSRERSVRRPFDVAGRSGCTGPPTTKNSAAWTTFDMRSDCSVTRDDPA